jgi:hypothetical protein
MVWYGSNCMLMYDYMVATLTLCGFYVLVERHILPFWSILNYSHVVNVPNEYPSNVS